MATFEEVMNYLGYQVQTDYWNQFTESEKKGIKTLQKTFEQIFNECKFDYIKLTELVIVLNHKLWMHYDNCDKELARFYDKLWKQSDSYVCNNLKGSELNYFLKTTD